MNYKRAMSYMGHVIWQNLEFNTFAFANGDGTDLVFDNIWSAMTAIEKIEEAKEARKEGKA